MIKKSRLLFLILILTVCFSSLGICIEPKYFWTIYVDEFNRTTKESNRLYTLNFEEIYKNQDWMEYKISNSGWLCTLNSTSKGDNVNSKNDDGTLGIVERLEVRCSNDGRRNIVYSNVECYKFDSGGSINESGGRSGGLSFIKLNGKGEMIYSKNHHQCYECNF